MEKQIRDFYWPQSAALYPGEQFRGPPIARSRSKIIFADASVNAAAALCCSGLTHWNKQHRSPGLAGNDGDAKNSKRHDWQSDKKISAKLLASYANILEQPMPVGSSFGGAKSAWRKS